jgi:hypothetical protein
MDTLVADLKSTDGSPGLVPQRVLSLDLLEYEDFETPSDLALWRGSAITIGTATTVVTRTSAQAFTGEAALSVTTTGHPGAPPDWAHWAKPFRADIVTGQVYWPSNGAASPDWTHDWAQVCEVGGPWNCVFLPTTLDRWNTFTIDLSVLNLQGPTEIWFQGDIKGASAKTPYTFYLDNIQVFALR